MEFPNIGKRCNHLECEQLDFLPIECDLCKMIFCREHSAPLVHGCFENIDNVVSVIKVSDAVSFKCSQDGCSESNVVELLCGKCEKHHCLAHRHHGCFDPDKKEIEKEKDKWRANRQQLIKVKAEIDKQVDEKLKAAQQKSSASRAMANKIRLMKIKGKAVGDTRVPTADRLYFLVHPPAAAAAPAKDSRPLYLSKDWSVGKATDYCAKRLKVDNQNNQLNTPKLRLFMKDTGELITNDMDCILGSLLNDTIIDGDSLLLEYLDSENAIKSGSV